MTLLTIIVPAYNSADYLRRSVDSLLVGGKDVQVIIVNDGSTDTTEVIAEEYRQQFPGLVDVINKPNGGHGSAINAGLAAATGKYLKIVDSDDWLAPAPYQEVLAYLRLLEEENSEIDLLISNFVYENENKRRKKCARYTNALPTGRVFGWDEVGNFRLWQYLLMHSMIYRTDVLRDCKLQLPEHSFYVDNLYAFIPLVHVERICYLDVDLYRYFIGREDQSVNEKVMISRIDQQIRINHAMFSYLSQVRRTRQVSACLARYMVHYLEIITLVTSILLLRSRQSDHLVEKDELWRSMGEEDAPLTRYMRKRIFGRFVNIPGRVGTEISILGYKGAKAVIGFN